MNNRFAFAAGLAVSALAFGCVAAVAAPTEEAPAPENVIDVPAVELEATVTPAPVVVEEAPAAPAPAPVAEDEIPAPVMTTDPLPREEAPLTYEEAPAKEAPAPLTYEETVALFGESFAVGDVIVCPEGWTVATDTTAEGFHWAACM